MSNQADHTIVRLRVPPDLKKKIEESADQSNRSQSAEMVARLEQSFNEPMSFNPNDTEAITRLVAKSMQELLLALSNQGVGGEQTLSALREVSGSKKAP